VRIGEIDDMNEVTNGGAVWGRIVRAEDLDARNPSTEHGHDPRHEVGRFGSGFSQVTFRISPRGIRIPKTDPSGSAGPFEPREHALDDRL
jgi:hypothetical protein